MHRSNKRPGVVHHSSLADAQKQQKARSCPPLISSRCTEATKGQELSTTHLQQMHRSNKRPGVVHHSSLADAQKQQKARSCPPLISSRCTEATKGQELSTTHLQQMHRSNKRPGVVHHSSLADAQKQQKARSCPPLISSRCTEANKRPGVVHHSSQADAQKQQKARSCPPLISRRCTEATKGQELSTTHLQQMHRRNKRPGVVHHSSLAEAQKARSCPPLISSRCTEATKGQELSTTHFQQMHRSNKRPGVVHHSSLADAQKARSCPPLISSRCTEATKGQELSTTHLQQMHRSNKRPGVVHHSSLADAQKQQKEQTKKVKRFVKIKQK